MMSMRIGSIQSPRRKEGERQYNEQLQQVHQQFLRHKESTNAKLSRIEELLDLAIQKLNSTTNVTSEEEFVKSFGWKQTDEKGKNEKVVKKEAWAHLKLEFPKYKEGKGVTEWIQECEEYFGIFGVSDSEKTKIAGMHLEGIARCWYQSLSVKGTNVSWKSFVGQFEATFRVKEYELQQADSVETSSQFSSNQEEWIYHVGREPSPGLNLQDSKVNGPVIDNSVSQDSKVLERKPYGQEEVNQQDVSGDTTSKSHDLGKVYVHAIEGVPKYDDYPDEEEADGHATEMVLSALEINESRLRSASCFIPTCQGLTFSKVLDKELECTQQHFPKGPQVKITSDEAKGGVMQILNDDEPIYDEECWPEHEFISAATSSNLLQLDFCSSDRLEEDLRNKPKVLEDGDKLKLVDDKGEEKQDVVEAESSIILEEWMKDVSCRDSPTVLNSANMEKKSTNLDEQNMIIFDPGGFMQKNHSFRRS